MEKGYGVERLNGQVTHLKGGGGRDVREGVSQGDPWGSTVSVLCPYMVIITN